MTSVATAGSPPPSPPATSGRLKWQLARCWHEARRPSSKPSPTSKGATEMAAASVIASQTDRQTETLATSSAVFRHYRSPQLIAVALGASLAARVALGGWRWGDLLVMAILVALLPFIEWFTHV